MNKTPPRVLLHTCCGPCATHCITILQGEGFAVTLYFSNSNIFPREEYEKRLAAARALAASTGIALCVDDYDHDAWLAAVSGLENEPEKGNRCPVCFAFSLGRTAAFARDHDFEHFTTTLTVSPHKQTPVIFAVGGQWERFLAVNFKRGDGFRHSLELTRKYGLYRQDYCGCEFSMRPGSALTK